MGKVNHVFLSLGSDIDDRLFFIMSAISRIEETIGKVLKKSSVYESEAIGFESKSMFYNICIEVETKLNPFEFLKKTQIIETEIGRTKKTTNNYESRIIDIDIIFFGDEIIDSTLLQVPHKFYQQRKFVLLPLNEIYDKIKTPESTDSLKEKLDKCNDQSFIQKTTHIV